MSTTTVPQNGKSNTVQIRRYTSDSIQKLYEQMKPHTLPSNIQATIKNIQKELAEIKTESENRSQRNHRQFKHRTPKRSSSSSSSTSSSNITICRYTVEPVDEYVNFQKKSNLILNSLIGSNVKDVGERLIRLTKQQKELLELNQDTIAKYGNHICSQIVENATMQSIYSQAYVNVVKNCVASMRESLYTELGRWIQERIATLVLHVESSQITRFSAKGNAKLTTYLYIENLIDRVQFDEYIQQWLTRISENEQHICELLVHVFLTLSEYVSHKKEWLPFVKSTIQPLWEEGSSIGMRSQIRLWDIRDAYVCL